MTSKKKKTRKFRANIWIENICLLTGIALIIFGSWKIGVALVIGAVIINYSYRRKRK